MKTVCKYSGSPWHSSSCKLLRSLFSYSPIISFLLGCFLSPLNLYANIPRSSFTTIPFPFSLTILLTFIFLLFPLLYISLPLFKFLPSLLYFCEPQLLPAACCQKYVKVVRTRTAQIVHSRSWRASEVKCGKGKEV